MELISFLPEETNTFQTFSSERDNISRDKILSRRFRAVVALVHEEHKYFIKILGQKIWRQGKDLKSNFELKESQK